MKVTKEARREFVITSGLQEGYAESAPVHSKEEMLGIISAWIAERTQQGKPVVSGTLIAADFVYPYEGGARTEPAVRYQGNVRDEDASAAEEMLKDLSLRLATGLGQERVHCFYGDERWVILP